MKSNTKYNLILLIISSLMHIALKDGSQNAVAPAQHVEKTLPKHCYCSLMGQM